MDGEETQPFESLEPTEESPTPPVEQPADDTDKVETFILLALLFLHI